MSQYELMYIIGSHISDDQIPSVTEEVKKFIGDGGGTVSKHEDLGKRKLAYPIKKTRNGNYVVVNFSAPPENINAIEHKVRTSQSIIRHLILNLDEALVRIEKDRVLQSKLKPRIKPEERKEPTEKPGKKVEIDLDAEIEKALESEELK
ncbi:MAG: 30S ribosomal protein S6 [Parcubacteria group bacterium GW2011_GWA2_51_12]|nr:MAG: 30S ribosomal protein S6 [Parcubacteria group bacterium GW2011_GWA2_51_12]